MASSSQVGRLANFWYIIQPFVFILILLFLSLYTNDAIIRYRMLEYDRGMEELSRNQNHNHSLTMLARFEMIEQRTDLPDVDESLLEMKLQAFSTDYLVGEERIESLQHIVIGKVINFVRWLLGKENRIIHLPQASIRELELAYAYERGRKYEQALEIYERVRGQVTGNSGLHATMLLHMGFCKSMLGDHSGAVEELRKVHSVASGSRESGVATQLIARILSLQDRIKVAQTRNLGPFQAAREMYRLANYLEAIRMLGEFVIDPQGDKGNTLEAMYLLGRSQEELGREEEALGQYRQIMARHPASQWAKRANRRMYLMGRLYSNDTAMVQTAMKRVEEYEDFSFINQLKNIHLPEKRAVTARVAGWSDSLADGMPAAGTSNFDAVDISDLRGVKEAGGRSLDAEALVVGLKGPETMAQVKTAKPKAVLKVADPLRRDAVQSTIQGNRRELEFIYQTWLRKGEVFEGNLTIRIIIQPSGEVRDARIVTERSTVTQPVFIAEILRNVKKWRFRPFSGGDLPVSFPVQFVNKE